MFYSEMIKYFLIFLFSHEGPESPVDCSQSAGLVPGCRQTLPAAASLPPSSVLLANPRLGQPRVVLLGLGPGCCCSEGGEGRGGGRQDMVLYLGTG